MVEQIFGHIPRYPEGSRFDSREALSRAGVHRPRIAGISGRGREGADSVVLAGGYEDWDDFGDEILYTGHGGRDPESKRQIGHQTLTRGNLALATNRLSGLPVRVIRGALLHSSYSPEVGYRYDGLYQVEDYWRERGRSGFHVWRYRLRKIRDSAFQGSVVVRTIYETQAGGEVKALYQYRCQICRTRLTSPVGPYAETVHIRPLAAPHNGPDTPDNILCLCPNHRLLFEVGAVAVAEDFTLIGHDGTLMVDFRHLLNKDHFRYRRMHYPVEPDAD